MDRHTKELSRAGLGIFDKHLTPEYEHTRRLLLARLATSGVSLESLVEKDTIERDNVKLIEDFCTHLPKAEQTPDLREWGFRSTDPNDMRLFGLNVIWIAARIDYGAVDRIPYYVVGRRKAEGKTFHNHLLLASAVGEDMEISGKFNSYKGKLIKLPVQRGYKPFDEILDLQGSDFPTPAEIETMFDRDAHLFSFTNRSPRTLNFHDTVQGGTIDLHLGKTPIVSHLSDEQLGLYDVNRHMHELAAQFGKVKELDSLLAA